jgi:hypothetical protein
MGQRVSFATAQWANKPGKPSCLEQGQWDAMNSSGFNCVPFAGKFALTDAQIKDLKVKGLEQGAFDAYKNAVQAIQLGSCPGDEGGPFIGQQLTEDELNLPELKETDITVKCEDIKMKVWDGSTYYDRSGASKKFTWNTCQGDAKPNRRTVGIRDFKAPSARSDVYIPVCGPGTHILEITKDQLMQIVWKVSQFDLEASGISSSSYAKRTQDTSYFNPQNGPWTITIENTAKTSTKDLDPEPKTPGKESEIVNLNWPECEEMGYSGYEEADSDGVKTGTSNGNVTASFKADNLPDGPNGSEDYYMYFNGAASSYIRISTLPFSNRHQYIYFVADETSGEEKIYFDPTGLFNFGISSSGTGGYFTGNSRGGISASYGLDAANILAEHSITLDFLGKIYTIYIYGPTNENFTLVHTEYKFNFDAGATITITSKKYYPYANSEGEDVYDEDTGARLKDPLS